MSPRSPVLRAAHATKSFPTPGGSVSVLSDVTLDVFDGEFVIVTGPSGSGKTTFLNLAGLLDLPTSGRIEVDGADTTAMSEDARCAARACAIGFVFQKFCLLPHRSVLDNVIFRYRYVPHDPDEVRNRALDLLDRLEVGHVARTPARLLSAGEMQRVAIARAVVLRPRLLLADEPTGNLDRTAAVAVMECLRQLHAEGLAVLLVTHNESLLRYGSRHLVCRDGFIGGAS